MSLQAWRKAIEHGRLGNFAEIKATFGAVDKVGKYFVFDIGGNKFRLVAAIHFNTHMLCVRHVFTHAQYDKWEP